ncbi:growth factor receptor-bound protein 14-like isoform X2 [Sitophilus oryzae]|uniref:Growth factor receptor-bound protein 14-like isoform X2 n=1 Tax=Sitophilus oryzae TaxID=7048 RepID=A0A6J2YRP2_SITOR|nr:growth factor receptor-bound protein 14-like isoform X2 [Sitophilus oryzae]
MSRNLLERMSFRQSSRREHIPHERLRDTSPRQKLSLIGRMGLCICMIREIRGGGIHKMCHVCAPKKLAKLEDEFRDMFERNMTVVCFFEKPTHSQFWPIMVFDNTSGILALELLAVTVQKPNKYEYGIVERWMNYNCHRVVEDHEIIVDVVKEQKMLSQTTGRFQFGYEKNVGKYNFIINKEEIEIDLDGEINPVYCSTVYVKQHDDYPTIDDIEKRGKKDQSEFEKKFLLVRNRNLYFVNSHKNMIRLYYEDDPLFMADRMRDTDRVEEERILTHIAHLSDIHCYTMENVSKYYDTDFKVACLIKNRDPLFGRTIRLIFCCKSIRRDEKEADVIDRWVVAIRVARDGRKLKKNYFAIRMLAYGGDERLKLPDIQKNKILQDLGYKLDQADPRVAMDFSKGIGRIVQDPDEAAEIARSEKRSHTITAERQEASSSSSGIISAPLDVMRFGPHLTQRYYHGNMVTRSRANAILKRLNCPGAFLLRDSSTKPGILVISYMCATEVKHVFVVPIVQIDDETGDHMYLVSCDGKLLFYNVHSLIDFHKLNLMPPFKQKLQNCVPNTENPDYSPKRNRRTLKDKQLADISIGIKQENIRRALTYNITGTSAAIIDLLERSRISRSSDERRSASPTVDEAQMLDLSLNEPSGSGMSRERLSPTLSPLEEVPSSGDSDSPPRM